MIKVTPVEGYRILNPFNANQELKAEGEDVPDDIYWRRREREGAVTITAAE
jgi:hypothetical protein